MRLRLDPFFSQFTSAMFFRDPDDGGGAGGGEGGVTAVADAPTVDADLMDFQPPDAGAITAAITGKPEAKPAAKPDAKPAEKKVETPKPGEKPAAGEKKGGDQQGAAQLRKEYEATKKKLEEAETKLAAGDPRVKQLEADLLAKGKEIEEHKGKLTEAEKRIMMAHPAVSAKLREMDEKYNGESERFFTRVPELDQPTMTAFVREYASLPFNKPEYKEARAKFEETVQEKLGSERKLGTVLDFVERSYEWMKERSMTERTIAQDARKIVFDAERGDYKNRSDRVNQILEAAKGIPDGLEAANPHHPKVAIKTFMSALGEEKAVELTKGVPEFVKLVMAGVAPRSDQDYAGMTQQQIAEAQQNEMRRFGSARDNAVDLLYNGTIAMRLLPSLVKEVQRLSEALATKAGDLPPDPTKEGGDGGEGEVDDVSKYKPPSLDNLSFT